MRVRIKFHNDIPREDKNSLLFKKGVIYNANFTNKDIYVNDVTTGVSYSFLRRDYIILKTSLWKRITQTFKYFRSLP